MLQKDAPCDLISGGFSVSQVQFAMEEQDWAETRTPEPPDPAFSALAS